MIEIAKLTKILLVEDNPDDIEITKRALKEANVLNQLWIVRDGQEALDFLYNRGEYSDKQENPPPGLILLDINLPRISGIEVLKELKEDSELKSIPVVMLTVSKRDEDIAKGDGVGCNSYIQKPVEFEKFVNIVKQIGFYWGLLNVETP